MKIRDADIIIIPGYTNSGPDHWQSRWEAKLPNTIRVEQDDWHKPVLAGLGGAGTGRRGRSLPPHRVGRSFARSVDRRAGRPCDERGAAFADQRCISRRAAGCGERRHPPETPADLRPVTNRAVAFPSIVVASRDDGFCDYERAGDMANAWGSMLVDARESGHINADSGHGPWPDGLMVFANFMKNL